MPPSTTPRPRVALLVEPRLLVDLLRRELEREGATVLVDDTSSEVDLVIASASRTAERQADGTPWVTIPAHGPGTTIADSRGTFVRNLDQLLTTAIADASG